MSSANDFSNKLRVIIYQETKKAYNEKTNL